MAQLIKGNYSALMWVQDELQKSLNTALQSLQAFIDTGDSNLLPGCIEQLYQTNGTLQMLNLQGAQLLTAEMQSLCQQLRTPEFTNNDDAKEVLLRSLLLLPNYLKLLGEEFPDHPLCLIESINELREVRQQKPYPAEDFFQLPPSVNLPEGIAPDPLRKPPSIDIAPQQLAAAYQRLLLNWLKQQDDASLRKMRGLLNYLRLASHQEKTTQLWWAAEALFEALLQRGLTADANIKQLIGKLAPPIKIFGEQGESALLPAFPESLLQLLLLTVARANSHGVLVTSLKQAYQLHFFDQQKAIYGMSDNALADAHAALIEDLQKLKSQINDFEPSAADANEVGDIAQQLLSMADTLSLLNENAGSELIHKQHQQLLTLTEQVPETANHILTELADSLLQLEKQLKQHGNDQSGIDTTELQQTVVKECLFELGNIKENLTLAAQQGDISSELIDSSCQGLQLITGSLDMLNLTDAALLLTATVNKLQSQPSDEPLTTSAIQQLAEILSAAELYMESVERHGQSSPQLIENAHQILDKFGLIEDEVLPESFAPDISVTSFDKPVNLIEKPITGVEAYIQQQADSAPAQQIREEAPITEAPVETRLTSVEKYIQAQADSAPASIPDDTSFEVEIETNTTEKPMSSVEAYIQQLNSGKAEAEAEAEAEAPVLSFDDSETDTLTWSFDTDNETTSPQVEETEDFDLTIDFSDIPEPFAEPETSPVAESTEFSLEIPEISETTAADSLVGFAEGIDPDIAEVFLEEAEEVLAELNQLIPDWCAEQSVEVLSDIRRHFHTLKGSGRMAGAMAVGDVAWSVESLLNRVLEGFAADSSQLSAMLTQAPVVIADMVERFSHGDMSSTADADQMVLLATAIREGQTQPIEQAVEPETDDVVIETLPTSLTGVEQYIQQHSTSAISTEKQPTSVDRYIERLAESDATTTILTDVTTIEKYIQNHIEPEVETIDLEDDEDAELLEIFLSEARQHVLTLTEASYNLHVGDNIDKPQLSAAHSLKGCANIAGVTPVALIATELDQTLREMHRQQQQLNADDLSLLKQVYQNLHHLIETINDGASEPDISLLHRQILNLRPDAVVADAQQVIAMDPEQLVSFLEETDTLLDSYTRQLTEWQQTGQENHQQALQETLKALAENADDAELPALAALYQLLDGLIQHPQANTPEVIGLLEQVYEMLNNQIEALIQNKPMADLTPLRDHIAATLDSLDNNAADTPESNPIPAEPVISALADEGYDSVDPDLLEAFTEEAAELLESSNEAIKLWQQTPDNDAASMQLQRDLHTLKGGARLTEVTAIADLTHQIETLVISVCDDKQPADEAFFDLLQRCQDQLSVMQEQLAARRTIIVNESLLAEINAFSSGESMVITQPLPELTTPSPVEPATPALNPSEQIRVRADLLDYLSNFAGEVSISRDRVTQQHQALRQQLREMEETVTRLHDQLRKLEIETETQILFRYEDGSADHHAEFDPLELDRFSTIQQLSRSLTESVIDLNDISQSMDQLVRETDTILLQQSRLNTDLQHGLMHTRLVPFSFIVPRLERIVRQTASETGKAAQLSVDGGAQELDRAILDRLVAPIEHILRNAIAHGIETNREQYGKPDAGQLHIDLRREGSEVLLSIRDDGQGLNIGKIREKALALKLIAPSDNPSDEMLMQLILTSGFSTADNVSQLAGRGVGMDVVNNEIRALKGRLSIESVAGKGSSFHIRLPLTLSLIQALLVTANQQQFAIPLSTVKAGERLAVSDIRELLTQPQPIYRFNDEDYEFVPLSHLLGEPLDLPENARQPMPLLLFRSGSVRVALLVDEINSNREIVIKSLGKQMSQINAINGATILGDGRVVLILDIPTLISVHRKQQAGNTDVPEEVVLQKQAEERLPVAMVVDDSITMRKATGGLLTRLGFNVMTAKDGVDALAQLYEQQPDIILLDVEMPRMDGFEFASIVRNDAKFQHLPIIMITSRTGDKHRHRAMGIGVNDYLGKPYQENELVAAMKQLLGSHYPQRRP
ncbi:Hpt domain-containing protein [Methylophaga sp. OBS3]|uniref:hybrid sensor histidine kinase/response regulator n=1 Tax=Methylophaga sp. OBS3 TaxID=2991934 RepID=UPI00224CDF0C|nr:Hpt domain-containing protein [Methylophaga sp. OBS3]MCX4189938.1 Hpt domain-containing protein [Methylophaga sp. OBS3]